MGASFTLTLVDRVTGSATSASKALGEVDKSLRTVREASGRLRGLDTGRYTKGLSEFGSAGENSSGALAAIGAGAMVAFQGLQLLGGALTFVGEKALGLAVAGAKYAAEMAAFKEQTLFAYKYVLGGARQANEMWAAADNLGRATGMKTTDVADSIRELISGGFKTDEARAITAAIADVKAMNPAANVGAISTQLAQMKGAGRVLAEDLKPLLNAGVNDDIFYSVLREMKGEKDQAKLKKLLESGKVSAEEGTAAILETVRRMGGSKELGEVAAARARETVPGAIDALKANFERLFLSIQSGPVGAVVLNITKMLSGAVDPESGTGARLLALFNTIADAGGGLLDRIFPKSEHGGGFLGAVVSGLERVVPLVLDLVGAGADVLDNLFGGGKAEAVLDALVSAFQVVAPLAKALLGGFGAGFSEAISALGTVLKSVFSGMDLGKGQGMADVFRSIGKAAGFIVVGIGVVVGALATLAAFWASVVPALGATIGFVAVWIVEQIVDIGSALVDLVVTLGNTALGIGTAIVQGIASGLTSGKEWIVGIVRDLGDSIIGAVKTVLRIASPSKVMEELGGYTVEGFAKGVAANDNAERAMSNAVEPPAVNARATGGGAGVSFGDIHIHIEGATGDPEAIAQAVRREFERFMREQALAVGAAA